MAEHQRLHGEGAACAGVGRAEPERPGKNGDQEAHLLGRAWCPAVACRDGGEQAGRDTGGERPDVKAEVSAQEDETEPVH